VVFLPEERFQNPILRSMVSYHPIQEEHPKLLDL
jgi:hypothetical protein